MNTARIKKYVELNRRKNELRDDLAATQSEIDALMPEILEDFGDSGISNVNIDGYTVYLTAQLWASPQGGDYERACDALIEAGLGEFVGRRFNTQTVSSWVREHIRGEDGDYPESPEDALAATQPALAGALSVAKKWDVRCVAAGKRGRG